MARAGAVSDGESGLLLAARDGESSRSNGRRSGLPASTGSGFERPEDCLVDVAKVARRLEECLRGHRDAFEVPDGCDFPTLCEKTDDNFRALRLIFISELKGTTRWARLRRTLSSYWRKNVLIRTIEATRHVLETSYTCRHVLDVLICHEENVASQYHGHLGSVHLDWNLDTATNSTVVKLLHVLCLMALIGMPGRTVGGMTDLTDVALTFARMLQDPPHASMLCRHHVSFDDVKRASVSAGRSQGGSREAFFDVCPDWLPNETCLAKVTRLYLEKLKVRDDAEMPSPDWYRARADLRILSSFRDLLSMVLGCLQEELDLVSAIENKVMGALATSAFALISFVYDWRFRDLVEDRMSRLSNATGLTEAMPHVEIPHVPFS